MNVISILQMKKLRLGEGKGIPQGHIARNWQNMDLSPGLHDSKSHDLSTLPNCLGGQGLEILSQKEGLKEVMNALPGGETTQGQGQPSPTHLFEAYWYWYVCFNGGANTCVGHVCDDVMPEC